MKLAQQNLNDYLTISADIAEIAVQLFKFFVDTKKLLYGFPLNNIPSASQETNIKQSITNVNSLLSQNNNNNININNSQNDNSSVLSRNTSFSSVSSICPFDGDTVDEAIRKILFYPERTITSTKVAQILRVRIAF